MGFGVQSKAQTDSNSIYLKKANEMMEMHVNPLLGLTASLFFKNKTLYRKLADFKLRQATGIERVGAFYKTAISYFFNLLRASTSLIFFKK